MSFLYGLEEVNGRRRRADEEIDGRTVGVRWEAAVVNENIDADLSGHKFFTINALIITLKKDPYPTRDQIFRLS